jgi:TRAP-type mannitol/chloroaromatic compound transport system permease large subunit
MLLLLLLSVVILGLLTGFPVAFVLGGSSILVALIAASLGAFDLHLLAALPNRIYGIMNNDLLIAVPLFVFMGTVLERAKIAEELLEGMASSFGKIKGGLGLSVMLVGALLAASTGIVGATVVTMGLISLPSMLKAGYKPSVATGSICAAGTLGQIIPPSIVLILLGDQISNAYQTAQMDLCIVSTQPVSIADLFL